MHTVIASPKIHISPTSPAAMPAKVQRVALCLRRAVDLEAYTQLVESMSHARVLVRTTHPKAVLAEAVRTQVDLLLIDGELALRLGPAEIAALHEDHGIAQVAILASVVAMVPKPDTSEPAPEHPVYPYLLRNLEISRPNQVWATDITYIPLDRGFAYLVAIIDWHSRRVLSWRLSNTLDSSFCVEALREAMKRFGKPEIFNTDQGAQFTSQAFTSVLRAADVRISMDGKGRCLDNVFVERVWRSLKYEEVYLHAYRDLVEARAGIGRYFDYYNHERDHQALGYQTPDAYYREMLPRAA